MIHNTSIDNVLLKKISLRLWSLRDEIEARIQQKIDNGEFSSEDQDSIDKSLLEIQNEYVPKESSSNVLEFKAQKNNEPSEDSENVSQLSNEEVASLVINDKDNTDQIFINIKADFIPEEKISSGKTILSEIAMDRMLFFSNRPFTEGQSIVIQFCIPKTFIVNADVMYCRPFNFKSRIISKNNFTHRMLVKFTFLKEGERALLRQFIQSIESKRGPALEESEKLESPEA